MAPYIAVTGTPGCEVVQYYVAAECSIITDSVSLHDAILVLVSAYHVYDVEYPKSSYPISIFIQHFVFGFKDGQKVPSSALKLASSVGKL